MLNIPAGSTGRMVKAKPVAKVEKKESRPVAAKQEESKPRTDRTRTRTKKFKES
jgi:hypothetical protein